MLPLRVQGDTHQAGKADCRCPPDNVEEVTRRNVETVFRSESAARSRRTVSDRIADAITAFCGSMPFVLVHLLWCGGWIGANIFLPAASRWDPFPFAVLTLIASSEAICLSTFILISQNRQSRLNERRDHLDLQVSLLAEQETTKMLTLIERIAERVGVEEARQDPEVRAFTETTCPEKLLNQIDQTLNHAERELK